MVLPEEYTAYDQEGKVINHFVAKDANSYINPNEVKVKVDNLKNVFQDQMKMIANELVSLEVDASEAIVVQGKKMDRDLSELAEGISKDVPASALNGIDSLYETAVSEHDKIQNELNDTAYNDALVAAGPNGYVKQKRSM